jgi:internalin A
MNLRSARFLQALLGSLSVSLIVAACGSDAQRKHAQTDEAGAGGMLPAVGGGMSEPDALAGAGGAPQVSLGGGAGQAAGSGGAPLIDEGGAAGAAGAAGAPAMLPELPPVDCDTIVFKDAVLDNVVRYEIGKLTGDITPADVVDFLDLDARDSGITDLSGVECLTSLQSAEFYGGEVPNQISDLTPLSYLSELTSLDVSNNPIGDLSPLVYLTKLKSLDLSYNAAPDLTPLSKLPSLQALHIEQATMQVPASLASLENVKELYAISTIDDGALIGGLTQLTHLELGFMAFTNADALGNLGNLGYLDAIDLGLTSAAPFATLTELTHLDLKENAFTDVGPLQNLTGLSYLGLFATPITSIQPLVQNQGLSSGDTLDISNTPLNCQTELANVTALVGRGVTVTGSPCN